MLFSTQRKFVWSLLLTILCCMTISPVWADFGTDVLVNDDSGYDQYLGTSGGDSPTLTSAAVFEDELYVVWADERAGVEGGADIYFAKGIFDAGGRLTGFTANIRINDVTGSVIGNHVSNPSIAVDEDGVILIVWADYRDDRNDIYLARSTDNGATFMADQRLNVYNPAQDLERRSPRIAAASGYIYVTFGSSSLLEYVVSTDGGASFSYPEAVTGGIADNAAIAANSNYVYIAQYEKTTGTSTDITFSRKPHTGAAFSAFEKVNTDSGDKLQSQPTLAAAGSNVYLAWRDRRNDANQLFYTRSTNEGAGFEAERQLADSYTAIVDPAISAYGSEVVLSFETNRTIMAIFSDDSGVNWGTAASVSDAGNPLDMGPSTVAMNDQTIGIAWQVKLSAVVTQDIYGDGYSTGGSASTSCVCGCDCDGTGMDGIEAVIILLQQLAGIER